MSSFKCLQRPLKCHLSTHTHTHTCNPFHLAANLILRTAQIRLLAQPPSASPCGPLFFSAYSHIPSFLSRVLALTTFAISLLLMRLLLPQLLPLEAGEDCWGQDELVFFCQFMAIRGGDLFLFFSFFFSLIMLGSRRHSFLPSKCDKISYTVFK